MDTSSRVPPLCPVCCDIDNPDLVYRRDRRDGLVHVNCPCCGYDRHAEIPEYRAIDDFAGGFCVGCRHPDEVAMRARNQARSAQLQILEAELATQALDPAVVAYLATKAARDATWGAFERMDCNDSYG